MIHWQQPELQAKRRRHTRTSVSFRFVLFAPSRVLPPLTDADHATAAPNHGLCRARSRALDSSSSQLCPRGREKDHRDTGDHKSATAKPQPHAPHRLEFSSPTTYEGERRKEKIVAFAVYFFLNSLQIWRFHPITYPPHLRHVSSSNIKKGEAKKGKKKKEKSRQRRQVKGLSSYLPNTKSMVPMTATASASRWSRQTWSKPPRWAKPGARMWTR